MFAHRIESKVSRLVVRSASIAFAAFALALVGAISTPPAQADESLYALMTRAPESPPGKHFKRTPAIHTQSGPVKGIFKGKTAEFLGIHYAAAPVGALRWTPPQPFGRFHGVLDASAFGSACTQGGRGREDCLFLNIYVPNFKKNGRKHHHGRLPVMFWIHGGGLTSGAGSDYDPTPLVDAGVIVVTINYRLGYLGFFAQTAIDAEGHVNGNYGLADQQFAMTWVQSNIANFGGDPSNVTIFGESAGGHSVYCHLASPTAAGLFAHAIAESGSFFIFETFLQGIIPLATAETTGDVFVPSGATIADTVGCSDQTAKCLRAVPNTTMVAGEARNLYAFVDGTLLTETPQAAFAAGTFNKVPIIAGTNHDESRFFVAEQYDLSGNPILTETEYEGAVTLWIGGFAAFVLDLYPYASYPSGGVALGASETDGIFACGARNADISLSQFTTTYAYEFNDESAPPLQSQILGLTFPLGAYHTAELEYLFVIGFFAEFNVAQVQLSAAMVSYWTNFAATGDPNSAATPTWSPYATNTDQFQSLIPPTPVGESTFNTDHNCDSFWNLLA
jgi:para-nitrobenzyl esterase